MSRPKLSRPPLPAQPRPRKKPGITRWTKPHDVPASFDAAKIAEALGMEALELAKRAQAVGLVTLGFLFESAALEAGEQAAALQWPDDAPGR